MGRVFTQYPYTNNVKYLSILSSQASLISQSSGSPLSLRAGEGGTAVFFLSGVDEVEHAVEDERGGGVAVCLVAECEQVHLASPNLAICAASVVDEVVEVDVVLAVLDGRPPLSTIIEEVSGRAREIDSIPSCIPGK